MRRITSVVAIVAGVACASAWMSASAAVAQEPETSTTGAEAAGATAVTVDQVAEAIAADGWYADESGAVDRTELASLASRLSGQSEPIGFAVLAAEPEGSSPAFAEQVLGALAGAGEYRMKTVAVLSPADVGVVSDAWDDDAIDAALDGSIDALRANPVEGLDALADALNDEETGSDEESSGGSNAGVILLAIGVGAIALIATVVRRLSPAGSGEGSGWGWSGRSSYSDRRRWRRNSLSSGFRRSSRSSGGRSRRSSGGSRRGRGGRRL